MVRRKKCIKKGCRQASENDSAYCSSHDSAAHPEDYIMKCSREQALSFQALDAEYKLQLQLVRTLEVLGENARMRYEGECRKRAEEKTALISQAAQLQRRYEMLVQEIANVHGLDPKKMTIDPESCVLRDLRGEIP